MTNTMSAKGESTSGRKIGIDIRCLMQQNYSGVAEYTYNLLDNLFRLDQQNKYLLFYNSQKDIRANLPQFEYSNVKFKGFHYPNKLFNLATRYFHYPKIDRLIGQIDIFFIPNFNFLALSKNCKKILTVHDLSFEIYPRFFNNKRQLWHKIISPQKTLAQINQVIADSNSTKNDLINLYQIPKNKIKVIYLGVDQRIYKKIEKTDPNLKLIQDRYKLPQEFILYLGTIEPRKNIDSLIQSFDLLKQNKKFKNLHLIIAGEKGWQTQKIFDLTERSNNKEQIKFIGYIKKQDKTYLYNLSKLFVFPSYYEGFGLPVLEAQACGTPVITGINSSLPEITGQSAYLINPDNLTEMKNAILQIMNNQKLKNKLIAKGFKNITRFNWEKTAQQTLELFNI